MATDSPTVPRRARDYVRRYRWAAYLMALLLCLAFGILFWFITPVEDRHGQSLWVLLAPNLLASAIITALFLLSEWLKSGDDELSRDEIAGMYSSATEQLAAMNRSLSESATATRRLTTAITAEEQTQALAQVGIVGAYEGRIVPNENEYLRRFLGAQHSVDLIGLDLSSITRRFDYYNSRFKPGLPIRVLLLDPTYPSTHHAYMDQRMREEREVSSVVSGAQKFCSMFASWREDLTEERRAGLRYDIRLYRALPAAHYVRYDDELLFGPYLLEKSSEHTFTLATQRNTPIFEQLTEHFEALWSDRWSRDVPAAWFDLKSDL